MFKSRPTISILLFLIVWLSAPILSIAAQIDLRLQDVLDVAAPDDTIPVIIRLSERLDPSVYKHLPKKRTPSSTGAGP